MWLESAAHQNSNKQSKSIKILNSNLEYSASSEDCVTICQAVAERMGTELADVQLGSVVCKIKWNFDGAEVTCSNGHVIKADAVIVTMSLGVLKVRSYHPEDTRKYQ